MRSATGAHPFWKALGFTLLAVIVVLTLAHCGGSSSPTSTTTTPPTTPPTTTPPPTTPSGIDVTTYHNDNSRTGLNASETALTTSNVASSTFGKLFTISTDGKVDAEPLYLSGVTVNGASHNMLFVASEHGTLYAFDADSGSALWQVSLLGSGETTSDPHSCGQISPEIGITATPVIDRSAGAHGTIYAVAMSKDGSGGYHQRLHALDITTGAEEFSGPQNIQATFSGSGDGSSGGTVTFAPGQYAERAGLLLVNGVLYTAWTSHCDSRPYTGWVISYDEATLAQVSVLNVTPNGNEGAIWMAGAGPAADSSGNIYLLDGNGSFDSSLNTNGFPAQGDYGNAFLKISTSNRQLAVADYFEMSNEVQENSNDADLGSGGTLLLPDMTDSAGKIWHLAVGAGKDSNIYVVDRDNLGKFNAGSNNIHQLLSGVLAGGAWSMPAYFNNTVYYGAVSNNIKAFAVSNAQLAASPSSQTVSNFTYPGATPSMSANGTSNGILWAVENTSPAVLHAYDATNLAHELYNTSQAASSRDQFGAGNKFITPMIVNGKVYVGTTTGVGVFGLLH